MYSFVLSRNLEFSLGGVWVHVSKERGMKKERGEGFFDPQLGRRPYEHRYIKLAICNAFS